MATQFDPIAKDESLNTTEVTPRNIADVLAEGLKGIEDALPTYTEGDGIDISAQKVISVDTTFSEAVTRANIASGDSFSTILGKIKKFFTDLKAVAFSGAAADVTYDNTQSGLTSTDVQNAIDKLGEKVKYKNVASNFILHSTATAVQSSFYLYGNVLFYSLWVTFSATPSAAIDVFYTTEYSFLQQSIGLCMITDGFGAPSDFLGYSISSNRITVNVGNTSKIVPGKYYVFTGAILVR